MTEFTGFPFGHDHPYNFDEGKDVLKLAMVELRKRRDLRDQLGMDPNVQGSRVIKGRKADEVWDYLSLSAATEATEHTENPHLTLVVSWQAVEALVIVPHAVNKVVRQKLIKFGEVDRFKELAKNMVDEFKKQLGDHKGATPWFRGHQRHYLSKGATPFVDARIEFDLRTAVPGEEPPKSQPRWLSAAYDSFVNKENSNYEIQMGVQFRYIRCYQELRRPDAIDLIAKAWLACKPLIDLVR